MGDMQAELFSTARAAVEKLDNQRSSCLEFRSQHASRNWIAPLVVKFATCTLLGAALTWWNVQIRTLGPDAYSITWEVLKKKMTDKYCPRGEIKKLEIELWNLKVKGNDVPTYTKCFQELTLICTKFVANETEKLSSSTVDSLINILGM
ncbi:reverse transcriptase domain-containing protein [Tanacetum coccineum]